MEHRETRHGATVVDNYFWLREKSNPKVVEYLKAENAYTEAMTKGIQPFADALYTEMLGRIKQTDLSVPVKRGSYLYYSRTEEGKQYPIQCRKRDPNGAEEVLLDLNALAKDHKFVGLGAFQVSDDQNLLAYTLDYTGFRQYTLQVKDLRTGRTLPDSTERVTSVQWASDNKTLFLGTEDAVTKRWDKLFRHALGTARFDPVFDEKDELYDIELGKTRDKRYLILEIEAKDTAEVRYLRADQPMAAWTVFLPREKGHRYYVDHRDNLFYIRSNKAGPNFSVADRAGEQSRAGQLEDLYSAAPERADRGHRSVPRLRGCRWRNRMRSNQIRIHNFKTSDVDADRAFRSRLFGASRRALRITIPRLTAITTRA